MKPTSGRSWPQPRAQAEEYVHCFQRSVGKLRHTSHNAKYRHDTLKRGHATGGALLLLLHAHAHAHAHAACAHHARGVHA